MIPFAYYLLKVILCSGVLFLYYHLALRNKLFHHWNRFFLLISILVSIVAPILQIGIIHYNSQQNNQAIRILKVFQPADGYLDEITVTSRHSNSLDQWLAIAYILVSFILFVSLLLSLRKVFSIIRSHSVQLIEKIRFITTNVNGTPFSFFNFIFWNDEIDLQTETGKQIFQHELVHVREKHTVDKLIIQLVLLVFWCNPFFWLMRRELRLIHEFIADEKSVGEHGTAALAAMILKSSYPIQFNTITNQFFQTSIKRRLMMLTKIENPRINYVSRVLALPILAATVLAFTLRAEKTVVSSPKLDREITVVIDAGHGRQNGTHTGARDGDAYEDQINLAIANKIKQLNTDDHIKIVLTRTSQDIVDLPKRVDIARENKADLFISIHVNALSPAAASGGNPDGNPHKGFEVVVPANVPTFQQQSETLGSAIQQELSSIYFTNPALIKPTVGVWVLNHNVCPSVLIECGYITDKKDREFITRENNQAAVAQKILQAIERYAGNKEDSKHVSNDTVPQKQNLQLKEVTIKDPNTSEKKNVIKIDLKNPQSHPLFIVDGKELDKAELDKIDPMTIESINVLKGETATTKYGKKGANGVIEVTLKPGKTIQQDLVNPTSTDTVAKTEPLFTKVEKEPSIDKEEWLAFLRKSLQPIIEQTTSKGAEPGTYTVKVEFIVKKDGSISDPKALNDPGYDVADKVVAIMKDSPKWNPAMQNGKPVNCYHTQPVTFVVQAQ